MLGKLMKHEWRGYKVPLIVIFGILTFTTILAGIFISTYNPDYDEVISGFSSLFMIISFLLYYFGIIGCSLGSLLIIAIRFYKTCYTDQGYLTHTLPAKPSQILGAKIITAVLQYILIAVGITASIFVLVQVLFSRMIALGNDEFTDISLADLYPLFSEEFTHEFGMSFTAFLIFMIIFALISCVSAILTIFGCISLGQFFTKHRIIGAIVAYFGVNTIFQILGFISSIPMYAKIGYAESLGNTLTPVEALSPTFIIALISSIVVIIVMYFISLNAMTKKLNLE